MVGDRRHQYDGRTSMKTLDASTRRRHGRRRRPLCNSHVSYIVGKQQQQHPCSSSSLRPPPLAAPASRRLTINQAVLCLRYASRRLLAAACGCGCCRCSGGGDVDDSDDDDGDSPRDDGTVVVVVEWLNVCVLLPRSSFRILRDRLCRRVARLRCCAVYSRSWWRATTSRRKWSCIQARGEGVDRQEGQARGEARKGTGEVGGGR
jgi:hypothetical protein